MSEMPATTDLLDAYCEAHSRVAAAIADSTSLSDVVPVLLEAVSRSFGWQVAACWLVDDAGLLSCMEIWHDARVDARAFTEATWSFRFEPGVGLPGRVWVAGEPEWVRDVTADTNFPRARAAAVSGMHAALCLPMSVQREGSAEVVGVVEFLVDEVRDEDRAMVRLVSVMCEHVAYVMLRDQLERHTRQERSVELHEGVVEVLGLAQAALATGQVQQAQRLVDQALEASERIARTIDGATLVDEPVELPLNGAGGGGGNNWPNSAGLGESAV